jgi:hypothetical protein
MRMHSWQQPQPCYTGIAPSDFKHEVIATPKNNWELVEQYYLEPLRAMKGHEAFACLTICFPLYEKLLRKALEIPDEEKFSQGHRVFDNIGKDWQISAEQAYQFWSHWRNGLLHRGMPKANEKFTTWLTPIGKQGIVVNADGHISLNPWVFRDRILELLEGNKRIWKDEDFPLLQEVRQV